jgi:uncharacterized protein
VAVVKCPHCGAAVEWDESSPHRPFCSERCRLIDLGEWFAEEHRVPGTDIDPPDFEQVASNDD